MASEVEAFIDKVEDMVKESNLYISKTVGSLTMIATGLTVAGLNLRSNDPADSEAAETSE